MKNTSFIICSEWELYVEKAMAPHSSTLAWQIPWMEDPGGLQSMGSLTVKLSNFPFTFHFPALEKEMATHSSVLAWRIPRTGEPGELPSMGSHRVGHDWSDLATAWPWTCELICLTSVSSFCTVGRETLPYFRLKIAPPLTDIHTQIILDNVGGILMLLWGSL